MGQIKFTLYLSIQLWNRRIGSFKNKSWIALPIDTNEKLYRFGLVASPSCTFCRETAESIEHLLFSCKISSEFWKHVLFWLKDNGIHMETLKEWGIIFGKFNIKDNFTLINHLLGKYYIYWIILKTVRIIYRRLRVLLPGLNWFIDWIELQIARAKN